MEYGTIKALHIIFMVTWFAGLFYMFRLFVYHAEAALKTEPARSILMEQYKLMERRLWYAITWPSAILTLVFGVWLLILVPAWLSQPWMHIKLFFVFVLYIYQFYGHRIFKRIQSDAVSLSSMKMRLLNEVPTVILIAVVFLVVNKESISWLWGTLGIIGVASIITIAAYSYKRKRERSNQ